MDACAVQVHDALRLPRPATQERGEGWGEGNLLRLVNILCASSPRPSPPCRMEEREFAARGAGTPDHLRKMCGSGEAGGGVMENGPKPRSSSNAGERGNFLRQFFFGLH